MLEHPLRVRDQRAEWAVCEFCESDFLTPTAPTSRQRFCSRRCQAQVITRKYPVELTEMLELMYADMPQRALADFFGVSVRWVQIRAGKRRLVKSDAYRSTAAGWRWWAEDPEIRAVQALAIRIKAEATKRQRELHG